MSTLFDTRCYRVMKFLCLVVGIWPSQSVYIKKILQMFSLFVIFSFLVPQVRTLYYMREKDVARICMCIQPIFTITIVLTKCAIPTVFESEIKHLLRNIEEDWKTCSNEEEYKILVNYGLKSRRLCILYLSVIGNGILCFDLIPIIPPVLDIILPYNESRVKDLSFDLNYGVDFQTYFYYIWLHVSVAAIVVITNALAADSLYFTLTIHGCYLFAITKYRLEHTTNLVKEYTVQSLETCGCNAERNIYQYENKQKEFPAIRKCILSHKRAIEFAQLLQYIYSWSLFSATILNLVIMSISAVHLVSQLSQWNDMMLSIIYVGIEFVHLFFQTIVAQEILDQSLSVHESAYLFPWYNAPAKIQKNIILVLLRSQVPCPLTAGGFFILSFESFCTILQTSMSYFTVLASFR